MELTPSEDAAPSEDISVEVRKSEGDTLADSRGEALGAAGGKTLEERDAEAVFSFSDRVSCARLTCVTTLALWKRSL